MAKKSGFSVGFKGFLEILTRAYGMTFMKKGYLSFVRIIPRICWVIEFASE